MCAVVLRGEASNLTLSGLELLGILGNTGGSLGILHLLLRDLGGVRRRRMTDSLVRLGHLLLSFLEVLHLLGMLTTGIGHRFGILRDLRGLITLDPVLVLLRFVKVLGTGSDGGLRLIEESLGSVRILLLQVGILGLLCSGSAVRIGNVLGGGNLLVQCGNSSAERIKLGLARRVLGEALVLAAAVVVVDLRRDHLLDGFLDSAPLGLGTGLDLGLGLGAIVRRFLAEEGVHVIISGEEAAAPGEPVLPVTRLRAGLHAALLTLEPRPEVGHRLLNDFELLGRLDFSNGDSGY